MSWVAKVEGEEVARTDTAQEMMAQLARTGLRGAIVQWERVSQEDRERVREDREEDPVVENWNRSFSVDVDLGEVSPETRRILHGVGEDVATLCRPRLKDFAGDKRVAEAMATGRHLHLLETEPFAGTLDWRCLNGNCR